MHSKLNKLEYYAKLLEQILIILGEEEFKYVILALIMIILEIVCLSFHKNFGVNCVINISEMYQMSSQLIFIKFCGRTLVNVDVEKHTMRNAKMLASAS